MKAHRIPGLTLSLVFLFVALFSVDVSAQARRRGLYGDWRVKSEFNGREFESIIALSRDGEGNLTGQWISFWGISDLKDVSFEDGKLSFARSRQNRDGDTVTSKFTGTIQEGKLAGSVSSERGDYELKGSRSPRIGRAVGSWETKFKVGDREITNTLVVKAGKEDALAVDWKSERVEHKISAVQYERGKLTFKTESKLDDRQWESSFDATFRGDAYSGVIKLEQGETPVEGKRVGAPLIGTWILDINSEFGDRKQRLRVFPDMSALLGATQIKKVQLQDGKASFKWSVEFGDQTFEMDFQAKLDEKNNLAGEITTSRGTQKVTGKKVTRRPRQDRPRTTL